MEKVAKAGAVTLKHAGRSMLVESVEDGSPAEMPSTIAESPAETAAPDAQAPPSTRGASAERGAEDDGDEEEQLPASPMSLQDGIRAVQRAFTDSPPSRWPLYVRQAKQHLRNAVDGFDERKYGFASVVDLLRAAAKEGVIRIERDRQGAIRVFPGTNLAPKPAMPVDEPEMLDVEEVNFNVVSADIMSEPVENPPIVDVEPELVDEQPAAAEAPKNARKRKAPARAARSAKTARPAKPRTRKPARPTS